MNGIVARYHIFTGLALAVAGLTVGCTHEYEITPTYQKSLAALPARPVCAQGESIQVSVVNGSATPLQAGQVSAGFHTFNHQFNRDPALALQEGLNAALRDGQCASSSPSTADLKVELVNMEAHGLSCGFVSCEGTALTSVSITLKDASGKVLAQDTISTDAHEECGLTFCSEEETSAMASEVLSKAVGKAVGTISAGLSRRAAPAPVAAAQPGS